ncbi:MAG: hypothetical protein KBE53_00950 [Chromatiaceae bacterium]|nr:hypothetical protein [Chromatiaceae bacterium]
MKCKTLNLNEQSKAMHRPGAGRPEISNREMRDRLAQGLASGFWAEADQGNHAFAAVGPLTPEVLRRIPEPNLVFYCQHGPGAGTGHYQRHEFVSRAKAQRLALPDANSTNRA